MGSILKLLARRSESAYSAFLGRDPWECARRHRKVNITSRDNKLNADFVVICAGVGCVCGVWSDWRSPGTGGPSFRPSSLPEFVPLSPSTPSVASSPLEPLPSPGVVSSGRATFPFGFALLVSLGPGALPPFGSVGCWWYLQHPDELSAAPVDSGWLADGTLELSNSTLTLVGCTGSCPRSKTACSYGEYSSTQKSALPSHECSSTKLTESRLDLQFALTATRATSRRLCSYAYSAQGETADAKWSVSS